METLVSVRSIAKVDVYKEIIPQIESLIRDESDLIANLANTASALKFAFPSFSWVGFYVNRSGELVLGPFQGKPACVRIQMGRGVCGTAAQEKKTIIVPSVYEFPGHIFCDPDSKSEIVVPLLSDNEVLGVLDVDSALFNTFDTVDQRFLEEIASMIAVKF